DGRHGIGLGKVSLPHGGAVFRGLTERFDVLWVDGRGFSKRTSGFEERAVAPLPEVTEFDECLRPLVRGRSIGIEPIDPALEISDGIIEWRIDQRELERRGRGRSPAFSRG